MSASTRLTLQTASPPQQQSGIMLMLDSTTAHEGDASEITFLSPLDTSHSEDANAPTLPHHLTLPNTVSSHTFSSPPSEEPHSAWSSKGAKIAYFAKDCTEITPYLFVAGKQVASDCAILQGKGITHVVNCVGDVCENYFPQCFKYLKLYLLDSASEDIMCVLYKVIDFIDNVRKENGRVLVHCQQGVSRSTIMCIAYLMYFNNSDYDEIYEYVRARRGVCRPNVGFMCQLLAWRKRITGQSFRPYCFYRIGPHNTRDQKLVTKWVDRIELSSLDSRTLFLLQASRPRQPESGTLYDELSSPAARTRNNSNTSNSNSNTPKNTIPHIIWIWIGMLCTAEQEKSYIPYIVHLIQKVQEIESASNHVVVIRQQGWELFHSKKHQKHLSVASPRAAAAPSLRHQLPASSSFDDLHSSFSNNPTVLTAESFNSLYPFATEEETQIFYNVFKLSYNSTDNFKRHNQESKMEDEANNGTNTPTASCILINHTYDDDYPDTSIPTALDPSLQSTYVLPTVSVVADLPQNNKRKPTSDRPESRRDRDLDMVDDDTSGGGIQMLDETPSSTAQNIPMISFSSEADEHTSPPTQLTLPQNRLFVTCNSSNSSTHSSPRLLPRQPNLSISTNSRSSTFRRPNLQITSHFDDNGMPLPQSPMEIEIETTMVPEPLQLNSYPQSSPIHSSHATHQLHYLSQDVAASPAHNLFGLSLNSEMMSPFPPSSAPDSNVSVSITQHPPDTAPSEFDTSSVSNYFLYQFPDLENAIHPFSRASINPQHIYLLYCTTNNLLHVWFPPPGPHLFIPSKHEGDRESFAEEISRIFSGTFGVPVQELAVEYCGRESEVFWNAFKIEAAANNYPAQPYTKKTEEM